MRISGLTIKRRDYTQQKSTIEKAIPEKAVTYKNYFNR
tara:strand:+ start:58179 stop:58292 length:114 start_codon:yes stop_codon:yes gene_type:complete